MHPEAMAESLRNLSISVHDLSAPNLEALFGKGWRKADVGAIQRSNLNLAVAEKDSISKTSPLPLPEHVLQLIIDVVLQERDQYLASCAAEDASFTHKAVEHAYRFDGDLKNLSLVSRLWTPLVRHALGKKLVLILDSKQLDTLQRVAESPLYGPWTTHVEILEMPYAPTRGKSYAEQIWALAGCTVARLENIRSFTINSRILCSSVGLLKGFLSSLRNLEELALLNTGPMFKPNDVNNCLSFQLPRLRKLTFQRCLPVSNDTSRDSQATQIALDFTHQLRAMQLLHFTTNRCCFVGRQVSFVSDAKKMQWWIDGLEVTNSSGRCGEGCQYEDTSGVCASVRSLRLITNTNFNLSCMTKVLRNCSHAKVAYLTLQLLPTQDVFDALSDTLEEAVFEITPVPDREERLLLDKQLAQFCDARRSTLRLLKLSVGAGERDCQNLFHLTQASCSKLAVDFTAFCDDRSVLNEGA